MAEHITIRPAEGTWVVRAGGAVLGESDRALKLVEGDNPFVIYFPREDIAMEFLDTSDKKSTSPQLGEASYFSIVTKSTTLQNSVWSYEAPDEVANEIAGYLAFFAGDLVAVEQI